MERVHSTFLRNSGYKIHVFIATMRRLLADCNVYLIKPPPQNVGAILDSLCRVGRSVRPSPIRVRSITSLLMEGFPSNLNDTFTSTRGCAEPMFPMCQFKVKVTVKGQLFYKQILHIMSCCSLDPIPME